MCHIPATQTIAFTSAVIHFSPRENNGVIPGDSKEMLRC